jgi:predicted nuclease of predicted toxin-antitoxin system
LKILADENVPLEIVEWLRSESQDVSWVAEATPSSHDQDLLALAVTENRIVLTRDRDFGELVFRLRQNPAPVVLMRLHMLHPRLRLRVMQRMWPEIERRIEGHFIVVLPGRLRIRTLERP